MSDFGMFESDEAAANEPRLAAKTAARHLEAAIDTVRAQFGRFLQGATGIDEFGDRWHYSKHDIRAAVEPYVFPATGTMRRIQNAMKADWKLAHPYKLAGGERNLSPEEAHAMFDSGHDPYGPSRIYAEMPDGQITGIKSHQHVDRSAANGDRIYLKENAGEGRIRQALSHDEAGYGQMSTQNTRRNQDLDETYHPSSGNLIPQGDFEGWKNSVDQGGPEKVESHAFTPGGDSGSNKHARRWLQADGEAGSQPVGGASWDGPGTGGVVDMNSEPAAGSISPEPGLPTYETRSARRRQAGDHEIDNGGPDMVNPYTGLSGGPHNVNPGWNDGDPTTRSWEPLQPLGSRKIADVEAAKLVADIYTDFARSNGMRVASMDSLDAYASTGIADTDYRILANLIRIAEEEKAADEDEADDSEGEDTEDYDFGGDDDAGDDEAPESDDDDEDGDGDHDDDDHHTEDDDEDYDFGGGDAGGGQQYTVPEQAPQLPPEMIGEIPQDDTDGSAPVPPEVIDSLLGLPPGTIEQLLLEEVEQGAQGGEEGLSGGPMPPQGDPGMGGAPQGGGDDFFGQGGDDAEQEPPRVARRRQSILDRPGGYGPNLDYAIQRGKDREQELKQMTRSDIAQMVDPETGEPIKGTSVLVSRRNAARRFWAADGDQEPQEDPSGGEQPPQGDPTQGGGDPAAGGMDPAAMGGGMMPPPGSGAVAPPAPPQPLENQPAEDALLDTANQAIMQMIDQETAEYQQIIAPLSQALQAVQMAQQVEQAEHPMDVTPPQGTVDVAPSAAPGGAATPQQQLAHLIRQQQRPQRQAKKVRTLRNAAHLIARTYGVSERMLIQAMGRRHYEHVAEAFHILPPQALRSPEVQAAALHIANMFAAENTMFNKNAFMQSVIGPASGSRLPFDRPRTAGETWKNTSTMDIYEHRGAGVQPEITDNMPINNLPDMPGASKHSALTPRQADLMTKLRGWMQRQQDAGNNRGGDAMADQYLSEHPKIGPRGSGQVHQVFNADPHAPGDKAPPKVPEVPVLKAKNPVTKRGSWGEWEPTKQASFFTRRVPGWKWDDHLSGYLSKEARDFACSCGQKVASPSYKTCGCGKVWNVYAIGDSHHLASDTAEVYIAREIPVRPGVIMANRKLAEGYTPPPSYGDGDYHPGEPSAHDYSADTPHNGVLRDYHNFLDQATDGWHSGEAMDHYIDTHDIGPDERKILEQHRQDWMSPRGMTREDKVNLMSTPHQSWNPDDKQDPFDPRLIGASRRQAKDGGCTCWEGYERVPGTEPCASGSCRKKTGARKLAGDGMSYEDAMAHIDQALAEGEHVDRSTGDWRNTFCGHPGCEAEIEGDVDSLHDDTPFKDRRNNLQGTDGHHHFPEEWTEKYREGAVVQAQQSHAELVAMIDKLADWTKYDSPDPINDMGKSKPASTSVPKPPKDWATRLPKGDPSKKGGTWTPPTIPRAKK